MAKRIRPYRRLSMSAKTAEVILNLAHLTHADHDAKCDGDGVCSHQESKTLPMADLVVSGVKVGKKRATFDVPDPYSTDDYEEARVLLHSLASRIMKYAETRERKSQTKNALRRICEEIRSYADRSPLEVIAEAAR